MNGISLLDGLAPVVDSAQGSVVRVEARRRGAGSGAVWAEGLIVTADHVVHREEDIRIGLSGGQTIQASLVGRDPGTDLALLKVDGGPLIPLIWRKPEEPRVGDLVLALGRPGRTIRATVGIISALAETTDGALGRYLHTDAALYPGFSGGPLIDAAGQALGINSAAIHRGTGLTVPARTVQRVVESLMQHGRVRRGYLGIGAQPVRLPSSATQEAGQSFGLLVVAVEPDSPAEASGLLLGDVLLTVDGQSVRDAEHLRAVLSGDRIGSAIPMKLLRAGRIEERSVTVGERA